MTDSDTLAEGTLGKTPGKRERLIGAACQLLYQQGVERTTLADIAQLADVPQGNVYYYFKTKGEIVEAVVQFHLGDIRATLAMLEQRHRTPKGRLKSLMGALAEQRDVIAQYGCPHGSLCSELDKREAISDHIAAELVRVPIAWAEEQFRSMGRKDAHDLAITLIAAYQGSALLANTLSEPDLIMRETRRLEKWIDALQT